MDSLLEGLIGDIEEESGLILLVDANKKRIKIELVSKGVEETLEEFGHLLLLSILSDDKLIFA